jgi:hypothetical protein
MGDIIFEEQALVHWNPLSFHTTRREFDHWQSAIIQGGTTGEFLAWKWIYEWAIRQAFRDRDRVSSQRKQDNHPSQEELSLTGWVVQLLGAFGLSDTALTPRPVTVWALEQAQEFHTQYVEQCRQLKIACQSVAEIEMAFRILYWIVHHFHWVHHDALTETPQSWSVLTAVSRIRPCCNPSALLLLKSVKSEGSDQNREIQMGYVVALRDMKKGEEITLSVLPSQLTHPSLFSRPMGCGCGQGICTITPNLSPPIPLITNIQNEWMNCRGGGVNVDRDGDDVKKPKKQKNQTPIPLGSRLCDWRPLMVSWFRHGPPTMVDNKSYEPWIASLTSQLRQPTVQHKSNLIWFMYYRTCRFLILYPMTTLQQLQQITNNELKTHGNRNKNRKEDALPKVHPHLLQFLKEWTDFFPENSITPTLRGSFRPAIRYPYLDEWWTTCMELYQKIGSLLWQTEKLIQRWNK